MDFTAWSQEYWDEAARVRARMDLVKKEGFPENREEERLQKRRLTILYSMYLDCTRTAKILSRRAARKGGM